MQTARAGFSLIQEWSRIIRIMCADYRIQAVTWVYSCLPCELRSLASALFQGSGTGLLLALRQGRCFLLASCAVLCRSAYTSKHCASLLCLSDVRSYCTSHSNKRNFFRVVRDFFGKACEGCCLGPV